MQLWSFPIISDDTNGSSEYSRIPFSLPSDAVFIAALIASLVVSLLKTQTKSVMEPSGVGTLRENPSSLPFKCGRTFPTAFAAPVEVGIILIAPALALLRSL